MNTTGTWLLLRRILAYEICGRNGHYTRSCAGSSYSALFIIHLRNTIDLKLVMIVFAEAHLSSILYIILSLPRWVLAQSLLAFSTMAQQLPAIQNPHLLLLPDWYVSSTMFLSASAQP